MTSAHSSTGTSIAKQAISKSVLFIRFVISFDYGENVAVELCSMPRNLIYLIISFMYSIPRSIRNSLI